MVGAGRDYGDVPPIKGIVAGTAGDHRSRVEVDDHPARLSSSTDSACMV